MSLMNQRLRRMGRHIPPVAVPKPATPEFPAWCVEGKGNAIIGRPINRNPPDWMLAAPHYPPLPEPPPGRVHETGCALCDVTSPAVEPDVRVTRYINQSFMATHDDPLLMDTTLDPKPRKGGRHRRQR